MGLLNKLCVGLLFFAAYNVDGMEKGIIVHKQIGTLKSLCIRQVAKNVARPETLENFGQGKIDYTWLPLELHQEVVLSAFPLKINHKDICSIAFCPTEKICLVARENGCIKTISTEDGKENDYMNLAKLTSQKQSTLAIDLSWSPNGQYFLVKHFFSGRKKQFFVFQFDSGVRQESHGVRDMYFTEKNNGTELLVETEQFVQKIFDLDNTNKLKYDNIYDIAYSADGTICLIRRDEEVVVFDERCKEELFVASNIDNALLSPNGSMLFTTSLDLETSQLISLSSDKKSFILNELYESAVFSSDNKYMIGFAGPFFDLYDISSRDTLNFHRISMDDITFVNFVSEGQYLWFDDEKDGYFIKVEDVISIAKKFPVKADGSLDNLLAQKIYKKSCKVEPFQTVTFGGPFVFITNGDKSAQLYCKGNAEPLLSLEGVMSCLFSKKNDIFFVKTDTQSYIYNLYNDLTIDQYLLKQLTIKNMLTEEIVSEKKHLSVIYDTLSDAQKEYFKKYVFA